MKFRKFGTGIRFSAILLFLLSLLAAFWSLLGIGYMVNEGYYESGFSFYKTEFCRTVTNRYASGVVFDYLPLTLKTNLSAEEQNRLSRYQSEFSADKTNFLFILTDDTGKVLLTNYHNENSGFQESQYYGQRDGFTTRQYTVNCYVKDPISATDDYNQPYSIFLTLYPMRYALFVSFAGAFLLAVCIFIYLMCAAGRKASGEIIGSAWNDGLPLDVFAAILLFAGYQSGRVAMSFNLPGNMSYGLLVMLPVSVIVFLYSAAVLAFCSSLAAQIKRGKWLRGTVIYRVLRVIARSLGKLFSFLPMIWKTAVLIAGYLFVNIFLSAFAVSSSRSSGGMFVWLLFNAAVFAALCFLLLQMKTLKRAGEQIAAGDYVSKIDTKSMVWDLKEHAEDLNNIRSGMSNAVEERLKSERLKTELITNVSHDLKTPLTSLINYIDILKKETFENEAVKEYISIIDRQSARLKKLTTDLLEASKAATGNLSVTLERTDLVELMNQSVGEYFERFETSRLEAIVQTNRENAVILADGKLLWRVIDNLLNNICKYSLQGTRVYIAIDAGDDRVRVIFRNISRDPLNIAPEELLERFVRGDAARSTDGSGLGLSIARNLTEMLNGCFELILEGDLFKVVLTFKTQQ